MIPRYARPQMVSIWSPETKFRIWFEIEAHATDALAELGVVPKEAAAKVWEKARDARFDVARIDAIEAEVKHDVIAFLTHLSEIVGPEARFVHQGMTSSDVLDTCLNVQLMRAADILIADVDALLAAIKKRAFEYRMTPTIGRSHGIHAEPTTFGVKLATYYAEFTRARARLVTAREEIATCAISGAVGTFANIDPAVEEHVAKAMNLKVEPVSTQVIPRDRHAAYFAALGVVASSLERLAIEIRHLQRTEVLEAEEYFSPGQKGSSAMPHKRNPVLTENVTGLARMVRSYAMPAMETQLNAVINKAGDYEGFSANYSGAGFSDMRFRFHGVDAGAFEAWVQKTRDSGATLTRADYLKLAAPSVREPVHRYAAVAPDLYHDILNRCVDSGAVCTDHMMAMDMGMAPRAGAHDASAGASAAQPRQ